MSFSLRLTPSWIKAASSKQAPPIPLDPHPFLQIIKSSKIASPAASGGFLQRVLLSDGTQSCWALLQPNEDISSRFPDNVMDHWVVKIMRFCMLDLPNGRILAVSSMEPIASLPKPITSSESNATEGGENIETPSGSLQKDLELFFQSKAFHDVVFILPDNKRLPAHKVILCARSTYFRALLSNGMKESDTEENNQPTEIEISAYNPNVFEIVLKWLYTDQLPSSLSSLYPINPHDPIEKSNIWLLWMASNFFCLEPLAKIVENRIIKLINKENVCLFWNYVTSLYQADNLVTACQKFFFNNLFDIIHTGGFLELDRHILKQTFYPEEHHLKDSLGLSISFSQKSMPFRTEAITRWTAYNQPNKLKRKIDDIFPDKLTNSKRMKIHEQIAS